VILGPSILSGLLPSIGEWVLPQTQVQGHLLEVVALIGVMLLMVVTGLETDLALIRRRAGIATGVAIGGLVVPFVTGLALGLLIPSDLLGDPERRIVFGLFLATALSISAIPVLAKVLMDLGLMRQQIGQTMLAAGIINDITGWTLLGLVTALASAESLTAGTLLGTIAMVLLFLAATATIGNWLVKQSLTLVQDRFRGQDMLLTLVIVLAFGWGAFTQALRLEPVLGAFAIGILFGRLPRLPTSVAQQVESMALAVFAPIFFAVAGLKVDVGGILEPRLLFIGLVVIAVATVGKVLGAYAGARLFSKQDHWSSLAYGAGLNARGALEIIIATIGLSLGILTSEMFSIIVVTAVVTSLMAPIGIRFCLARVKPAADEQRRLTREQTLEGRFTGGIRRVLVPVRPRLDLVATQTIEASIVLRLAGANTTSTTLLAVTEGADRDLANQYLGQLRLVFTNPHTTTRVISGDDPVTLILREAEGDYDLLVVGAPAMSETSDYLFGPVIDDLVRLADCPTLVVRSSDVAVDWSPRRILVPTNGTATAGRAADLAFAIADVDTEIIGVHIVSPSLVGTATRQDLAQNITAELEAVGLKLDQRITTHVRQAPVVETGILAEIDRWGVDLLVLGTNVRAGTTRLHLGPRVEYLARNAPCPVLILNT
jgi:Kef-type K+ transport system membrane component KefB